MKMTDFVQIIKKQGATGILAIWLWYTHNEGQDLKIRLYDCLKTPSYNNKQQSQQPSFKDSIVLSTFDDKKKRKTA